jgi:CRP/FNR family transcriptional regulator, nitrogen fixation regulation protein
LFELAIGRLKAGLTPRAWLVTDEPPTLARSAKKDPTPYFAKIGIKAADARNWTAHKVSSWRVRFNSNRTRDVEIVYVFLSDSLPHPPPSLARYLGAMVSTSIRHVGIVRSYARGSEIVHEDEPANCAYEVLSGTVCTSKTLREGGRQVTGFYFPGDVFGLESAKKHSVAAQAITNAQLRVLKKQALTALASSNREVANQLLALTARELTRKRDHVLLLLSTTAQERVICFLIDMVQRASPSEGLIVLPMFRQDIADYLGLTIETVSRTLCDLERRGAIEISGRRSIVLRNQFANGRGERPAELFEGVKGRRPKTEEELDEWMFSPEGKAATQFNLTSLSRWGERARS